MRVEAFSTKQELTCYKKACHYSLSILFPYIKLTGTWKNVLPGDLYNLLTIQTCPWSQIYGYMWS